MVKIFLPLNFWCGEVSSIEPTNDHRQFFIMLLEIFGIFTFVFVRVLYIGPDGKFAIAKDFPFTCKIGFSVCHDV